MPNSTQAPMAGRRVVSFESRRSQEMARLLARRGAEVLQAPSMREVPSPDTPAIDAFSQQLARAECDILLLLTGVGTTLLLEALGAEPGESGLQRLGKTRLCCRGPKPVAALKRFGLTPSAVAAEPNTWRQLLEALDTSGPLHGQRIVVQEYGSPHVELTAALRERGAQVSGLRVYRWALPEDTAPLTSALQAIAAGGVDAAVFTSAQQVHNVLHWANKLEVVSKFREQAQHRVVLASVGPVTTAALLRAGLSAQVEPAHPKMGHLANALAQHFAALQAG